MENFKITNTPPLPGEIDGSIYYNLAIEESFVQIGNTGLALINYPIKSGVHWNWHFLPDGKLHDMPLEDEPEDAIKYARIFEYAFYFLMQWYIANLNHPNAPKLITAVTNAKLAYNIENLFGEEAVRILPKNSTDEYECTIDLEAIRNDEVLMKRLKATAEFVSRHPYVIQKVSPV